MKIYKKFYVGSAVSRDLEIFEKIKKFSKFNYGIKFVNLLKNSESFNLKYLKKKLKKYPISLIFVKLYSEESNQKIYEALDRYVPNIPRINSLSSVKTCESRKETFRLIENPVKKLDIPKCYYSVNSAYEAVSNGTPLIIKLDTHNIRNLSKFDRIVGVAKTTYEFLKLIRQYDVENNILFFQEYLGKFEIVHKVYIIGSYIQTITSQNLLRQNKLTPLELLHIRVPLEKDLKRRIKRIGRKFGMSIFGVDLIIKDNVPYVVDINDFPSFSNIPEAISLISDYIYNYLDTRQNLTKIPSIFKVKTNIV